jgi:lysophospholipase L1-like esterase
MADLAISLHFNSVPAELTGHPGSRTNSYVAPGDHLGDAEMVAAKKTVHWYFITGVDVVDSTGGAAAVVILGDSITDGYGCTTDANNRWTDALARRLQTNQTTRSVGVLNQGIGGNRLLRDGLGPNALARFDRDVIGQTGVRWLVILEGINDLGTRTEARAKGESFASAADLIAAYDQMIERAHTHGIRVIGATLLPFLGSKNYWTADGDEDRQVVNAWIRTSGRFDAVIDFDAALREEKDPLRLAAAWDNDHLHPSLAGYQRMAESVDLRLFER